MPPLIHPEMLAARQAETGVAPGFQYEVKEGAAPYAMDVAADPEQIVTDDANMTIKLPFAASHGRDRVGDFLEVAGIETANHERNPLAYTDHGKKLWRPLGLDQEPKTKQYTVVISPDTGLATAVMYVDSRFRENVEMYDAYRRKLLNMGSIGYRPVEWVKLPAGDGFPEGKHLKRVELLETSAVFLACNPDCVRRLWDEPIEGKSLSDAMRAQLDPFRPPGKKPVVSVPRVWSDKGDVLLTVEVRGKSLGAGAMKTAKTKGAKTMDAMSATDTSAGGALATGKKPGEKDDVPATPEDAPEEGAQAPHGSEKLHAIYYTLEAVKELIDTDPQLVDNPDVQQLIADVDAKLDEICQMIGDGHEKSYPDFENPHEGKAEPEPEKPADKPAAPAAKDEEEEEEMPASKSYSWLPAVTRRTKDVRRNGKALDEPGTPPASVDKPDNFTKGVKDLHDHLMAASDESSGASPGAQKAHYRYARKLMELADQHGQEQGKALDQPGTPGASVDAPESIKALQAHLKGISDHLMAASDDAATPPQMQKAHYHYAMKAMELHDAVGGGALPPPQSSDKPDVPGRDYDPHAMPEVERKALDVMCKSFEEEVAARKARILQILNTATA